MAFQKLLWADVFLWTFLMKELSLKHCGETWTGIERTSRKPGISVRQWGYNTYSDPISGCVLPEKHQEIFVSNFLAHLFGQISNNLPYSILLYYTIYTIYTELYYTIHHTLDYFGSSFFTMKYNLTLLLRALCCFKVRKYGDNGSRVQDNERDTGRSQKIYSPISDLISQLCHSAITIFTIDFFLNFSL